MNNQSNVGLLISYAIMAVLLLAGCGSSNVAGSSGKNSAVSLSVQFPGKTSNGLSALISPSTMSIQINVYAGSPQQRGAWLGSTTIIAPQLGGPASGTVEVAYSGPAVVEIIGQNGASGTATAFMYATTNLTIGATSVVNTPLVEFFQGASIAATAAVWGPDSRYYILDQVFLDASQGSYVLGVRAFDTASGTSVYHYSYQNNDQTGANLVTHVIDGKITFPMDVPTNNGTDWNRYDMTLDFFPGGTASNLPTLTGVFMGTFTLDTAKTVIPGTGYAPGPPGSTAFTIPGLQWTNNFAPAQTTIPIGVF